MIAHRAVFLDVLVDELHLGNKFWTVQSSDACPRFSHGSDVLKMIARWMGRSSDEQMRGVEHKGQVQSTAGNFNQ